MVYCDNHFLEKPSGQKGQEELQLTKKTAMAKFMHETVLLIQEVESKIDE